MCMIKSENATEKDIGILCMYEAAQQMRGRAHTHILATSSSLYLSRALARARARKLSVFLSPRRLIAGGGTSAQ